MQRERDGRKRHRDGGREKKAQPLGKPRGGDKIQLSPECGLAPPAREDHRQETDIF